MVALLTPKITTLTIRAPRDARSIPRSHGNAHRRARALTRPPLHAISCLLAKLPDRLCAASPAAGSAARAGGHLGDGHRRAGAGARRLAGRADRRCWPRTWAAWRRSSSSCSPTGGCGRGRELARVRGSPLLRPGIARHLGRVGRGAVAGLLSCAVVLPCFGLVFARTPGCCPISPRGWRGRSRPTAQVAHPALRFPPDLALRAVLQLLVVAIPEELFYRGWMQTSWARGRAGARGTGPGRPPGRGLSLDPAPVRGRAPGRLPAVAAGHLPARGCGSGGCASAHGSIVGAGRRACALEPLHPGAGGELLRVRPGAGTGTGRCGPGGRRLQSPAMPAPSARCSRTWRSARSTRARPGPRGAAGGRGREEPDVERPSFQRDRDRLLHCKAFRRLAGKTQVFLAPRGDHYRTRLTHTLEVAQVGRSIARAMRLNEMLVEAMVMGHDLGHTPFGHAGERLLAAVVPGGFHHVVQSLRVVDVLEKEGRGLNLTAEVRDGILRHSKGKGNVLLHGLGREGAHAGGGDRPHRRHRGLREPRPRRRHPGRAASPRTTLPAEIRRRAGRRPLGAVRHPDPRRHQPHRPRGRRTRRDVTRGARGARWRCATSSTPRLREPGRARRVPEGAADPARPPRLVPGGPRPAGPRATA